MKASSTWTDSPGILPRLGQRQFAVLIATISVIFVLVAIPAHRYVSYFTPIFAYLFIVTLLLSLKFKRIGTILFNVSFVFLSLALFEGYLNFMLDETILLGSYTNSGYFMFDALRGYAAPERFAKYTSTKQYRTGEVVYEVTYTINEHGVRITPEDARYIDHPVWFFGCSVTIGEGVRDNESLPYAFSEKTGIKTHNFGFHGYGPHQMLRMLETGFAGGIDSKTPSIVYYNALSVHIDRSAGNAVWDKDGPKYVLVDGKPIYAGTFSDRSIMLKYVDKIANQSLIYQRVIRPYLFQTKESDKTLYIAIVKRAAEIVKEKYGARFVVVLWDVFMNKDEAAERDTKRIYDELAASGIEVAKVSSILGTDNPSQYWIKGDGHPSSVAFDKISSFLARTAPNR